MLSAGFVAVAVDFADRWAAPYDDEPFNPWPDPDAGIKPRPYNPDFKDAPKPKGKGRDPRQLKVLGTIHGHVHTTITVERPVQAPVQAQSASEPDSPERRARRWRAFIDSERAANADRRARAGK